MITITIQSDLDLTPSGKRTARWVYGTNGQPQHRWYVSGRLYSKRADPRRSPEWLAGDGAPGHCPQAWEALG